MTTNTDDQTINFPAPGGKNPRRQGQSIPLEKRRDLATDLMLKAWRRYLEVEQHERDAEGDHRQQDVPEKSRRLAAKRDTEALPVDRPRTCPVGAGDRNHKS